MCVCVCLCSELCDASANREQLKCCEGQCSKKVVEIPVEYSFIAKFYIIYIYIYI